MGKSHRPLSSKKTTYIDFKAHNSQGTWQMRDVNQTMQGVDTPTVDSLKPKEKTRIACWNVRTLYQTSKLAQVVREK